MADDGKAAGQVLDQDDGQVQDSASGHLLSLSDAASQLRISERTCRRWIKSGRLRAVRIGSTRKFSYGIPADAIKAAVQKAGAHQTRASDSNGNVQESVIGQVQEPAMADGDVLDVSAGKDIDSLVAFIREQQEKIIQLSGQVGFLQAQVQGQEKQIKLLQAPPEKPRRQWWRHLWPIGRRSQGD